MADQTAVKWHEIINAEKEAAALPFYSLYAEFAEAVKEREAKKREAGYWPFPKS